MSEQLAMLPDTLGSHVLLVVLSLALALVVATPLTLLALRSPRLRGTVLGVASTLQTIPGLALLALMVPLLAGLGTLLGVDLPTLGLLPALLALSAYALLPILRNAVVGLTEVDPGLVKAGRGLGMTDGQLLWQVQLPLAMPVLVAGVRTATVWTVGMATLGTPVGQTCLGNHIFAGLQTRNWTAVLVGCVAAAVLALVLDGLIAGVQHGLQQRQRAVVAACGAGVLSVFAAALILPLLARGGQGPPPVRVGSKPFTEQYILAELMVSRLEAAGIPATQVEGLGSTIAFDALSQGELDVSIDYSGTLWATVLGREGTAPRDQVLAATRDHLAAEHGLVQLGVLGFENAYAFAVPSTSSVRSLDELPGDARIGGDLEFFSRDEWFGVRDAYGLHGPTRSFDSTFMYDALAQGEVDTIAAYSSDGRIAAQELTLLEDPAGALPPYDAVLLLSEDAARRPELRAVLAPLVGAIDIARMQQANAMVDLEGRSVTEAAAWLAGELPAR